MFVIPSSADRPSVTRHTIITDGPILPHPVSIAGKKFRLEQISVTFQWNGSGWGNTSHRVGGTVLKKDGTDSLNTFSGTLWNRPVWLDEIANQLRPEGAPALPTSPFEVEVEA